MAARHRAKAEGDPFLVGRGRFKAVLEPMGLWEAFMRIPKRIQAAVVAKRWPDPALVIEPSARAAGKGFEIAARRAFESADVEHEGLTIAARDVLAIVTPLLLCIRDTRRTPTMDPALAAFFDAALHPLQRCYARQWKNALRAIYHPVLGLAYAHSDHQRLLLKSGLARMQRPDGTMQARVTVAGFAAQSRTMRIGGHEREVYRVAMQTGRGFRWVSWPGDKLKRPHWQEFPVYVQAHALRQLRRRMNLPEALPYLESWMGEALNDPKISPTPHSRDVLVLLRVAGHRVGYLVATPLADCVVVRTFLFLTMTPSPQANLLRRKLNITRREADRLGLHDLAAFTASDLRHDPQLRTLLESCDCGDLFKLSDDAADAADLAPETRPIAAEMREYLGLAA